jgi:hypothetical protein
MRVLSLIAPMTQLNTPYPSTRSKPCASCLRPAAQSGSFHRSACTVHSPVGRNPAQYGVTVQPLPPVSFARNDVGFDDPTGVDHDRLGVALKKALYNYAHGIGLEEDMRSWFADPVPRTRVARDRIERALAAPG